MNTEQGDMLPEGKARFVVQRISEGRNVAMVGDGIIDAPAIEVRTDACKIYSKGRCFFRKAI